MRARVLVALGAIAAVPTTACDSAKSYSFEVTFDETVATASVRAVVARIRRDGCAGDVVFEQTFRRDEPAAMDVTTLVDGPYGFEADAFDGTCAPVADGCRTLEMPEEETSITLVISAIAGGTPACSLTTCDDGVCRDRAMPDGGTDVARDGVPGLPPAPTVLSPWNGLATGSATAAVGAGAPPDHPLMPEVRWTEVAEALSYTLEMVRCDGTELAMCDLDAATTRIVVDGPPLRARPPSPLAVSDVSPVGARYAFRVGACAEPGGRLCNHSEPRYIDVGRLKEDVDGDGDGELYVISQGASPTTRLEEITGFDAGSDVATVALNIEGMRGVYWIGDYDADGMGELVITTDGAPGGRLIYVDDLAEAGALDETAPGADLGARVVGLGDVDGDGYADFAATVPGDEVRVQFGGPSWNPADGVVVRAAAELRYFAHDIAAVGDRDSDGLADLAILSRLAMDLARIEVYSFAGSAPRRIEMHDVPTGEALATSEPPPVVITGGYDMDDDGLPDIAVGQRLLSNLVILFAGTRRDQTGSSESVAFGAAVAAGDVDGTGRARIVVGDPLVVGPIGGGEAGKLVLVSYTGAPFVLLANPYFTSDDDHLGHEVTIVDLNGDGLDDFFTRSESGFLLDRLRFDTAVGGVRGDRLLFAPSGRSWLAMTR